MNFKDRYTTAELKAKISSELDLLKAAEEIDEDDEIIILEKEKEKEKEDKKTEISTEAYLNAEMINELINKIEQARVSSLRKI